MSVLRECMARQGLVSVATGMMAMLVVVGCGPGVKTVPVTGMVTFGGKPPPYGCIVNFLPMSGALAVDPVKDSGLGTAAGMGECDASGRFSVCCLRDRRGLIPGRYEVLVSCCEPVETPFATPVSVVPPDFKPPELVVPADARSVQYDIDVPGGAPK